MLALVVKLIDLVEALLDHFVNVTGTYWVMGSDYQWRADLNSDISHKGNETVGAVSTVIHLGSIFLAQLMNLLVFPWYNTIGGASTTLHNYPYPIGGATLP